MANWKENKLVAAVAGIVFILSVAVTVILLQPKKAPQGSSGAAILTPASTPFIK